jgi:hypothetical protein
MGMPLTRDLALGPASIFPSTLGNALQDCIIGAKHGPIDIPISASAFVVETGAPTRSQNIWTFQTNTGNVIVADLRLPVGTKITQLVWSFNRNSTDGSGGTFLQLNRYTRGGGSLFAQAISSTGITGTGWTTVIDSAGGDPGLPHDVQPGAFYQLWVQTLPPFSGPPKFDGVTITIERL